MRIDLTQLLNKRIPAVSFDFSIRPEMVDDAPGFPEDIALTQAVQVRGTITDNDGYMTLDAQVQTAYETVCDRCVRPIQNTLEFPFQRIIALDTKSVENTEEDELLWMHDGGVDFDRDVLEEVSLTLPVYHLCEEDCPGLCSSCGKRLDGACTCAEKKEIDPRMEIFQKLLDKMNS